MVRSPHVFLLGDFWNRRPGDYYPPALPDSARVAEPTEAEQQHRPKSKARARRGRGHCHIRDASTNVIIRADAVEESNSTRAAHRLFRRIKEADKSASKLIHPTHIRWPTPTLRHSLLAY
jgi:hypothetical protein